jgi:hypothetical protein
MTLRFSTRSKLKTSLTKMRCACSNKEGLSAFLLHAHRIFVHAHSTFPTPTLITITCTQVLWCLERLTRPTVSFSLSLYRHPFLYTLFSSRFTLIINNNKKFRYALIMPTPIYRTPPDGMSSMYMGRVVQDRSR